jgi:hypothetical protein
VDLTALRKRAGAKNWDLRRWIAAMRELESPGIVRRVPAPTEGRPRMLVMLTRHALQRVTERQEISELREISPGTSERRPLISLNSLISPVLAPQRVRENTALLTIGDGGDECVDIAV